MRLSPLLGFLPFTSAAPLTVNTTSGTYTGFVSPSHPNVAQWLGIPYATAPLGRLRFMPPLPASNAGSRNATFYKPICMQDSGNRTGVYWELVPEFQNKDPQSEDCLYLNIWAPAPAREITAGGERAKGEEKKERLLPVIIWVCGGSFKEGGGHADYQVPDRWIERTRGHVVVAFNYRLNVFGFPGYEGGKNVGLMDVRIVVEWTRDNIAGFGGDPKRMVLYGQSAGSSAVLSYGYANPTDPIVGGLIASSSGTSPTNPTNSSSFHDLAQTAGCANLTAAEELHCMQSIDAIELQKKVVGHFNFRPIADSITVFANMTERLEKGQVAKLPLIAGFTYNEGAAFGPFDINATSPAAPANASNPLSCGSIREANTRLQYNLTTYVYLYSGNFTNITPRYWLGGMHSSDIPLVFGTHAIARGNSTELEWQTSFAMQSFWVTFAANPSAAPRDHVGLAWPKYTKENAQIIVFGNETLPSAASVAPVSLAEYYAGGTC